ncbi:MAG: polysaccharide biosynthesis tyrosine autokinase [Chloroflexia bacterium]
MTPNSLLPALARWWRLAALYMLAGMAGALLSALLTTPVYQASTTLVVTNDVPSVTSNQYSAVLSGENLASTYSSMLATRPLLERAISSLGIPADARELKKHLAVKLVPNTNLISLAVEDPNPQRAVALVDAIAREFGDGIRRQNLERSSALKLRLQSELDQVRADLQSAQAQLAQLSDGSTTPEDLEQISRLQASITQNQANYQSLFKSTLDAELAEARTGSGIVAGEAQATADPVRPRPLQGALTAGLLGVLVSICVSILAGKVDDVIRTPASVTRAVGLPVLATASRGSAAEAFQVLATDLEFAKLDAPLRTLLVTSPRAGEGKSTVAANLALTIARRGQPAILVDANLRRPTLHARFGLQNQDGLSISLITPGAPAGQFLTATGIERLLLMASGPLPPNPTDLLSHRMAPLLRQLTLLAPDGLVIVDSPCISGTSDATTLASMCDGVVLVVEGGSTRSGALRKALNQLQGKIATGAPTPAAKPTSAGPRVLGVVLNQAARPSKADRRWTTGSKATSIHARIVRRPSSIVYPPSRGS